MKLIGNRHGDGEASVLFDYEFEAILQALRRDMRRERNAMHEGLEVDKVWHEENARMDVRMLEVLNPKHVGATLRPAPAEVSTLVVAQFAAQQGSSVAQVALSGS